MKKLLRGIHHFQNNVFSTKKELFEKLSREQKPETLFITCSDSRINPNLITHTEPGELFIVRNAGNIVPPHGPIVGGEAATIEFAITALGVKDVIVCGHSQCGAMKGLLHPEDLTELPAVAAWMTHAEATRRIIKENYADLPEDDKLNVATQENVLVQIENLKTLPSVASALSRGDLKIHAWVYKFETGEVFAFDPEQEEFVPVLEAGDFDGLQTTRTSSLASI